jgi:uncharacterized Zn finger protein
MIDSEMTYRGNHGGGEEKRHMVAKISRCNICGQFLDSKKELRKHKDKNHRISVSKIMMAAAAVEELTTTTTTTIPTVSALSTREWLTD